MKRTNYKEPSEYIPKEIRKKLKLGEFSDEAKPAKKTTKGTTKKKK